MKVNKLYLSYTNIEVILLYSAIEITFFGLAIVKLYRDNIMTTMHNIFYIVSTFVMLLTLCDLIIRLCSLLRKNSECNAMQSLKLSFRYNSVLLIVIAVCATFCITQTYYGRYPDNYISRCCDAAHMCLFCFAFIPFIILAFPQQNLNEGISSMNGLDYGTGMAYSYYYGYLRIVLPSTGTTTKGILEKIENFEDKHNVPVAVKKLFILIPSSTYLSPDLKELSYGWMENSQELEIEIRDRAGIKRRSYHNNIYKIYPEGKRCSVKPEYVAIEGATPMLTFFEVQKHYHPESSIYRKNREWIIRLFYEKLKELIDNDPDCKNLCELIYYDDQDLKGTKVNVAKIILERIATLKDQQ